MTSIDDLTIREARQLANLFDGRSATSGLNNFIGIKVIIRTYSAGCWFGTLSEKCGNEVILTQARRMWKWWAAESISLSAVAIYGINHQKSKIVEPVDSVWLEAIEIIPCAEISINSIEAALHVEAE